MPNDLTLCTCGHVPLVSHTCLIHEMPEHEALDVNIKLCYAHIRKLEERRMQMQEVKGNGQ
jgi:hypothetical protein